MREATRVARVAVVFQIMMSATDETQRFQLVGERDTDFSLEAPPVKRLFSYFPDSQNYTWYIPTRQTRKGVKWDDGRFLDIDDPSKIHWHVVVIAKYPIFSGGNT